MTREVRSYYTPTDADGPDIISAEQILDCVKAYRKKTEHQGKIFMFIKIGQAYELPEGEDIEVIEKKIVLGHHIDLGDEADAMTPERREIYEWHSEKD